MVVFSRAEAMNPTMRHQMEDICVIHKPGEWGSSRYTFVGLFDGHGGACPRFRKIVLSLSHAENQHGSPAVDFAGPGREMVDFLQHAMAFHVAEEMDHGQRTQKDDNDDDDTLERQLGRAFLAVDVHAKEVGIATSGATVAVCLIEEQHGEKEDDQDDADDDDADDHTSATTKKMTTKTKTTTIITANAGDSRVCLYRPHESGIRMTTDHVPTLVQEKDRIIAAGGFVTSNGRVCGVLAVSRSLGDQALKPYVVARPCIHQETVRDRDGTSFLIIACDGFWDVVSDMQAGQLVRQYLLFNQDDEDAAKESVAEFLVQVAVQYGTTDNVTIVVAWL
jgi:serine/threonine protein phosphatase PrpC